MADPYTVLNVSPSASPTTLRRAYKAAMLKAHPDRGGAGADSMNVKRCYDSITNVTKAPEPDSALTAWFAKMRRETKTQREVPNAYRDTMYDESVSGLTDIQTTDRHWRPAPAHPMGQHAGHQVGTQGGVSVDFDASSVKW